MMLIDDLNAVDAAAVEIEQNIKDIGADTSAATRTSTPITAEWLFAFPFPINEFGEHERLFGGVLVAVDFATSEVTLRWSVDTINLSGTWDVERLTKLTEALEGGK
jgi:hypothetical protein